ncbi:MULTISPECIES: hypothetical protein [unclassified Streptomyces]|uniref:hypothetical protein n=1 Tax=unclassified Streptomyces TaxID=2593676 RepID=UPI0011B0DF5C|nr:MULTISPECIES: hypothetical protein [unclassified Streptomyces]
MIIDPLDAKAIELRGAAPSKIENLEGAIEIEIRNQRILTRDNWDSIFTLWAYFANTIEEYRKTGEASFQFPDQPIKVSLTRASLNAVFSVKMGSEETRTELPEEIFVQAMRARGTDFLTSLEGKFCDDAEFIQKIIDRLNREPNERRVKDIPWQKRLTDLQVAAIRHAEQSTNRPVSSDEREKLIHVVAGQSGSFDELLSMLLTECRKFRSTPPK